MDSESSSRSMRLGTERCLYAAMAAAEPPPRVDIDTINRSDSGKEAQTINEQQRKSC